MITTYLINIISIACLAYTISIFEPFRNLKYILGFYSKFKNNLLIMLFNKITDCNKCLAFWFSVYYNSLINDTINGILQIITIASITSILSSYIAKKLK